VVSYGGKTIPRWRTTAISKIDILPYLSEKSPDFHEILYTAADFELSERHVIKNEKVALDRLRVRQNVFLVIITSHVVSNVQVFHALVALLPTFCLPAFSNIWRSARAKDVNVNIRTSQFRRLRT